VYNLWCYYVQCTRGLWSPIKGAAWLVARQRRPSSTRRCSQTISQIEGNSEKQGCQFGFFEAKFVTFGLLSTPLAFFIFDKRPNKIWLFLTFFGELDIYVNLAGFKMSLADFWALADF